jgi:transaldolase
MFKWARAVDARLPEGRNRHIKFPITHEGIKAARLALNDGISVNMTFCFSQEQAAVVYAATRGAQKGQVFISPFVGELDDMGYNGTDLIKNIVEMYKYGDGHVEVLTASIRNLDQLLYAISFGSDILTAPLSVLKEWAKTGMFMRDYDEYRRDDLKPIEYKDTSLSGYWRDFDIRHPLTSIGLQKLSEGWNKLVEK